MKRKIFQATAACVAVALLGIAWAFYWPRRYDAGLAKITAGDSKDSVVRIMGRPWKDEGCGIYLRGAPPGCVEELYYAHPLAPLAPHYWIVDLDSRKRVINTVTLISP